MSFVQIVSAFRLYSADVLLLALGVTLLTSLLKKTVMKSCDKKIFVFLPFILGIVLYAAYRMIVTGGATPLTDGIIHTLEGGFGCGCAATLYYVIYKQFLRGKFQKADPLLPLLDFLPEEKRAEAAKTLYDGSQGLTEEEMAAYFKETLNTFADPPMSEEELCATAEVLAEYLTSIRKN